MTILDEAIERYKDIANKDADCPGYCLCHCDKCAEQCRQIAEWLEELKAYRASVFSGDMTQSMLKEERNKAIDDFAERLTKYLGVENATKYGNKNAEQQRNSYDTLMKYEIADAIDDVVEQLKAGGENESK